ncbi:MAG TPA: hypothetical protein VKX25_11400 [Bryobacteraceae bacterium]|jgi:hypothetical protein|nr:hypothetical protein [Bryobacteraceae bacterium]
MKFLTRLGFLVLSSSLAVFGAIDGTVVNATAGKPAGGVSVSLLKPGQNGMQPLGSTTTDAAGHFVFERDQPGGGPQLLQASFEGVNYNKLLTPNVPTSNVELDVYGSTQSTAVARIAERMLLIEPSTSQIAVSETVIVENNSKTTYNNSSLGGLLFFLPPAANGQVRVNVQGPQGMPLPRAAERTGEKDVYKVDFPIKPGQTEFEVSYVLPAGSPFTFRSRVVSVKGMAAGPLRLIAPSGVSLSGSDLQRVGVEPKTQATIYTVLAAGNYSAQITGTGALHQPEAEATEPDTNDQPQVTQGMPRVYQHLGWLLGLAFATLGIGLAVLYRTSPVRPRS